MKNILLLFLFFAVTLVTPAYSQAQTDENGVVYTASGAAVEITAQQDQLFRLVNLVRERSSLEPLSYMDADQGAADIRAKMLVKSFRADTTSCRGEVVFRAENYDELAISVIDNKNPKNLQYLPDMTSASVALYKENGVLYAVLRTF